MNKLGPAQLCEHCAHSETLTVTMMLFTIHNYKPTRYYISDTS